MLALMLVQVKCRPKWAVPVLLMREVLPKVELADAIRILS